MISNREKAINRARKLLELSKSANEHEAAQAAARAAEIMLEHQLAEAELDQDIGEPEPITEECVGQDGKRVAWRLNIIHGLAKSLGCESWFQPGDVCRYYVVGPKSAIDSIRYLSKALQYEVNRLADKCYGDEARECKASGVEPPSARAWKGSFRVGCSTAIYRRLVAQRDKTLSNYKTPARGEYSDPNRATALAVVNAQALAAADWLERNRPGLRASRSSAGQSSRSGYQAGQAAGRTVNLGGNKSLGRGTTQLKGSG